MRFIVFFGFLFLFTFGVGGKKKENKNNIDFDHVGTAEEIVKKLHLKEIKDKVVEPTRYVKNPSNKFVISWLFFLDHLAKIFSRYACKAVCNYLDIFLPCNIARFTMFSMFLMNVNIVSIHS